MWRRTWNAVIVGTSYSPRRFRRWWDCRARVACMCQSALGRLAGVSSSLAPILCLEDGAAAAAHERKGHERREHNMTPKTVHLPPKTWAAAKGRKQPHNGHAQLAALHLYKGITGNSCLGGGRTTYSSQAAAAAAQHTELNASLLCECERGALAATL